MSMQAAKIYWQFCGFLEQNCAMFSRNPFQPVVWLPLLALVFALAAVPLSADGGKLREPVDVNSASVAELMAVPGMTASWAQRIVRFRPYWTKYNLVERGVVSPEVYQRIRDGLVAHRVSGAKAEATLNSSSGSCGSHP